MQEGDSFRFLMLGALGLGVTAYADLGLVGGQAQSGDAYAAFIEYPNGTLSPIAGLPAGTAINNVAINSSGFGVIVGSQGSNGYAALVSPDGTVTSLPSVNPTVDLLAAAINQSGTALIGGGASFGGPYYAAFVAPDGTVTPLTLNSNPGIITSVGLNDAGVGLLGGEGNSGAYLPDYAAYFVSGAEILLDVPGNEASLVNSVAINSSGNGIIGGNYYNGTDILAFASLATAGQTSLIPLGPIPNQDLGFISSVAINDSNASVIGGEDGSGNAYAAYCPGFADASNIQSLFLSPFPGEILSVSINNSGIALLGGYNNASGNVLYAALVQPDGTLIPLFSSPTGGQINSVSIDNQGVGLIGGQIGSEGYIALVAPNGSLTPLSLSDVSVINAVAINGSDQSITSMVSPQSIGAFQSTTYTQLAAVFALESRFMQQSRNWKQSQANYFARGSAKSEEGLIAANELSFMRNSKKPQRQEPISFNKNSIWLAPFGDFVHLQTQGNTPGVDNTIGGALLGYDRQDRHFLVGAAVGYAYNYLHYAQSLGHGHIQEEMGSIYAAYYRDHFWLGLAVWGGFYQLSNVRHGAFSITSRFKTHGWVLDPHLELATPWKLDSKGNYSIEPFIQLDWVNTWQKHFTETGSSGFNLVMPGLYGSLLQSEGGVRFFEKFSYGWGDFWLEEKISYVNQAPFFPNSVMTAFVSSAATFPVGVASNKVENLGCALLSASFNPRNSSYPFGGALFQVMANGVYQSYFGSLFIGMGF